MFPELVAVETVARLMWDRLVVARRDERGMTTETVIITAILAALAIAAGAIITAKVISKANDIPTR